MSEAMEVPWAYVMGLCLGLLIGYFLGRSDGRRAALAELEKQT